MVSGRAVRRHCSPEEWRGSTAAALSAHNALSCSGCQPRADGIPNGGGVGRQRLDGRSAVGGDDGVAIGGGVGDLLIAIRDGDIGRSQLRDTCRAVGGDDRRQVCLAFRLQRGRGGSGNEGSGSVEVVFASGDGAVSRVYLALRSNGDAGRALGGVDGGEGGFDCREGEGFLVGGGVDGDEGGMIGWDGDDGFEGNCAGFEGFETGAHSGVFPPGDGMDGDKGGMVGGNGDSSHSTELERFEGVFAAGAENRWRREDGAFRRGGWESR